MMRPFVELCCLAKVLFLGRVVLVTSSDGGSGTTATIGLHQQNKQNDVPVLLEQFDDLLAGWDRLEAKVDDILTSIDHTVKTVQDVEDQHTVDAEGHRAQIRTIWTTWNQRQYHDIQRKLKAVIAAEIHRREYARDQADEYKRQKEHIRRQKEQAAAGKMVEKLPPPKGLSWEEVAEILSPDKFVSERDELVGTWIADLLQHTMADRPVPVWEWAKDITIRNDTKSFLSNSENEETDTENDTEQGCLTLLDAVVHIQQALTNYSHEDGLGMMDHAQGGRIVHHDTSPTFHPDEPLTQETWGNSIWRNYLIPQEVEEYILSHIDGWENWPLWPTNYLPHSLARWAPRSHTTAPPETVLQGTTWPGACWPMEGHRGQITMVLPYPIHPTAISIDHVSRLLLKKDDDDRDTAPRTMRVWGYATCEDGDDCRGLEYDEDDAYDLFGGRTIEYDLNGSSVQTFWLPKPKSPKMEGEEADSASCTAPENDEDEEALMASCSGDYSVVETDTLVRAIKIEVIDNWGNSDYTCLYRARVHGNPVKVAALD